MNGWFEFNGVRCTQYGIIVSDLPDISLAEERVTFTDIPGRNGSLTQTEGEDVFKDFTATCKCWVPNLSDHDRAADFLHGSGWVRFANRKEGRYRARITNQIDMKRILRGRPHRSFNVNFRCKPFLYLDGDTVQTFTNSGGLVRNKGNVFSEPEITVYPQNAYVSELTDPSVLTVGGQMIELYGFKSPIIIDTEMMEAYYETTAMNNIMSGDFPTLKPGTSTITWNGNISKVEVRVRPRNR